MILMNKLNGFFILRIDLIYQDLDINIKPNDVIDNIVKRPRKLDL